MATLASGPLVPDTYLDELATRAEAIYESTLKAQLEPQHNNEFVALHVDTGDYAVAPTFREAKRIMLNRYSVDGKLVVMKIGPEPEIDSLAYRAFTLEQKPPQQK